MASRSFAIIVATLIALLALGCGDRVPETPASGEPVYTLENLPGVPLSPELAPHIQAALQRLAEPSPPGPGARQVERYLRISQAILNPETRQAAGDTLYHLWRQDPTNFLWIQAAATRNFLLQRTADRNAMYNLPALADTNTAVGAFVRGRRFFLYGDHGHFFRKADSLAVELDSLPRAWLVLMLAEVDSHHGAPLAGVQRLLDGLPNAEASGGPALSLLFWRAVTRGLMQADRLDDALHSLDLCRRFETVLDDPVIALDNQRILARIHAGRQEWARALGVYEQAITRSDSLQLTWHHYTTLDKAAQLFSEHGDHRRALGFDLLSVHHCIAAQDSLNLPRSLMNVANDLRMLGRLDSCRVVMDQARTIVERFPDERNQARLPALLAEYHLQVGNYATADSLLELASARMQDTGSGREEVIVLLGLAEQGLETGDPDLTRRSLGQIQRLRQVIEDQNLERNLEGEVELVTARFLTEETAFPEAAAALERATGLIDRWGGDGLDWRLAQLRGELALAREDLDSATGHFRRAQDIATAEENQDQGDLSLIWLGQTLLENGHPEGAVELLTEKFSDHLFGSRFRTRLYSLILLGRAWRESGQPEVAAQVLDRAEKLLTPHSPNDLAATLELERGRLEAATHHPREAETRFRNASERLVLGGSVPSSHELRRNNNRLVRDLAEAWIALLMPPEAPAAATATPRDAMALALAVQRGTPLHQALPRQDQLSPPEPSLVFFVGENQSWSWFSHGDFFHPSSLPGRRQLKEMLVPLLADMGHPDHPVHAPTVLGVSRLLLPETDLWETPDQVLTLVPDGILNLVPWYGLVLPDGAPLLDHAAIQILCPGPRPQAEPVDGDTPLNRPMLAIGMDSGENSDWSALHRAEEEARRVADLWPAGNRHLLLGPSAELGHLDAGSWKGIGTIHLATHAMARQGLNSPSSLLLPGRAEPLTATAIAGLDLDADLVYLSACETAGGSFHGTGVTSLARAFMTAGARSVIASSVKMDDESSLELAQAFYRHWTAGQNRAAALRAALLEIREGNAARSHPFYWSFVNLLIGS